MLHTCKEIGTQNEVEIVVNSDGKWELWLDNGGEQWGWFEIQFCPFCGLKLPVQEKE